MVKANCQNCGGCALRELDESTYRQTKENDFKRTLAQLKETSPAYDDPIFIADGSRRRANMSFALEKNIVKLGFNEAASHNLIDIEICPMLDSVINSFLPIFHHFLSEFSQIPITIKNKKKIITTQIRQGIVQILHADNGLDVLLEIDTAPSLEHRLLVADFVNNLPDICRFSWQIKSSPAETVVEKISPELHIANCVIKIPQGVFLQASKTAETLMIEKVLNYMGNTRGKIADLFCGLGTFTYPLAKQYGNEIISVDSFAPSLKGLEQALHFNQIHNVTVINKNLFKYPLDEADLKGVKALVIDPPRAGAHDQCREIVKIPADKRPEKIIFVSCNPKTFVYDAELLIAAGYRFERVTLVDQFVYSKHEELIALFTFNPKDKGE